MHNGFVAMSHIQIRFNTEYREGASTVFKWRVLVDGSEEGAREVKIKVPSWTTTDLLETGIVKHHISCEGTVHRCGDGVVEIR